MSLTKSDKKFLLEVLNIPTAPYREGLVLKAFQNYLRENRVPHFSDSFQNIVVGAESEGDYKRKISKVDNEPMRLFIAHTDHPGFHGEKWDNKGKLWVKWHGGSPTKFLNGSKVWIADAGGQLDVGTLSDVKMLKSGMAIDSAKVTGLKKIDKSISAKSLYGAFQFRKHVWSKGAVLYTKAADDLVGSVVIATMAATLYRDHPEAAKSFIGLLTRAEEVGFIGCLGHFSLGWLKLAKRPVLGVSLETSRTLPGAIVGKGPVVRLGDRASIFDSRSLEVLTQVAAKKLPGKFQRRVMDGGTCEGTVVTAYGFPCVALSIPLGNYHNQNYEGGPDARGKLGPAPEFVHTKDIEGMAVLCHGLMEQGLPWNAPWGPRQQALEKRLSDAMPFFSADLSTI